MFLALKRPPSVFVRMCFALRPACLQLSLVTWAHNLSAVQVLVKLESGLVEREVLERRLLEMELPEIELVEMELVEMKLVEMELVEMELVEIELVEMKLVEIELVEMKLIEISLSELKSPLPGAQVVLLFQSTPLRIGLS